jgi:hypothetical protein
MTAKKTTVKTDLKDEIKRLMTPDAAKELADLSPTFQQFLIRWTDLRDMVMKEEIMDTVGNALLKDNEALCKNVANVVCCQVAETISPIWNKLEEMSTRQKDIAADVGSIKTDILAIRTRLKCDEDSIISIDKRLRKVERYASIWQTVIRNAITAAITVGVSILVFLQLHDKLK